MKYSLLYGPLTHPIQSETDHLNSQQRRKLWNLLHKELRLLDTLSAFKKQLKMIYFALPMTLLLNLHEWS
jgi:hypothetical protein